MSLLSVVREGVHEFLTFRTYVSRHRGHFLDLERGPVVGSGGCDGGAGGGPIEGVGGAGLRRGTVVGL